MSHYSIHLSSFKSTIPVTHPPSDHLFHQLLILYQSTIQASATSVQLGENFSVTCMALGEPEIAVDFIWEYPGQKVSRGEEEVCMCVCGDGVLGRSMGVRN